MAEDPYKVLGVPRDAPDEEIRSAYRKLAKQLHPDLNPVNKASAEERFKKVSSAYDIVGDPVKRRQYDRGEIDANGEARRGFHRAHAGGAGPFGGRAGGAARAGRRLRLRRHLLRPLRRPRAPGRSRTGPSPRAAATCATRWRSTSWKPPRAPRSG